MAERKAVACLLLALLDDDDKKRRRGPTRNWIKRREQLLVEDFSPILSSQ